MLFHSQNRSQSPSKKYATLNTENSQSISTNMNTSRKKYLLLHKNKKMSLDISNIKKLTDNQPGLIKYNIFSSTIHTQQNCEDVGNNSYTTGREISKSFMNYNTINESKSFCESMLTPERKVIDIDNPQKLIIIPVITQSKYQFKFGNSLPKIERKMFRNSDPLFQKQSADFGKRNLNQMKKYKRIWENQIERRKNQSLLSRSLEKCKTYIQNHNKDVKIRQNQVSFETYLRNRHEQQVKSTLQPKGVLSPEMKGLKGKKGLNQSLFQQCYSIEQVYKSHK